MVVTWLKPLLLNIVLLFAATLGDEIEPSEYRMHGIIRPLTYDVTITLFSEKDAFTGESQIYIQIKRPTQYIALHAYELTVKSVKLFSFPHQVEHAYIGHEYNTKTEIVEFKFKEELIPGPYSLLLKFEGQISDEKKGFFKTMYTDTEGNQQWVLATHLRPTGARRLFPCWDEPASKATFGIKIKHPKDYVALSNMSVRKKEDVEDNVLTGFHDSPVMSPHLLAIVVGKFVKRSTSINNVNIYTLYEEKITDKYNILISGLFNADSLTKIAREYTHDFANASLMLEKIDHIIVPYLPDDNTENWGISLYREDNVDYDSRFSTLQNEAKVNVLMASKVAYQWISSIVGPYWWTEMWLSEALTMFLAQKILIQRPKNYLQFYYAHDLQYRNYRTNIYNITEEENEVNTVEEINRINHRSSNFVKGCALLRMLENIMTADVFQEGIRRYLRQFQFNLATVEEFWDALQYALDKSSIPHKDFSVKELMNNWLRQKYYPILNVIRDGDTIIIIQESANSEEYRNNKWRIPIILDIRTKNGSQIRTTNVYWLNPNETNIMINDVRKNELFIIYNIGNYRVSYNQVSWLQLLSILSSFNYAQVHEVQRAQIIDDAFYFLMKGKLEFQTFLDFTQYLQYERHYIPLLAVTNILPEYSHYFHLPESDLLKAHLSETFNKILEHIGYEEQPDNDENEKSVRLLTAKLSCDLGNIACRKAATNTLKDFLVDTAKFPMEQLSRWRNWIFCSGLMSANIDIWRKVLLNYQITGDKRLLIYLTCTEQSKIIMSYMNLLYDIPTSDLFDLYTITPLPLKLNDEEFDEIYASILKRYGNNLLVIEYILRNFDKIKPKSMSWNRALITIINNVYSQKVLNKLSSFIDTNDSKGSVEVKNAISNQMVVAKEVFAVISRFKI